MRMGSWDIKRMERRAQKRAARVCSDCNTPIPERHGTATLCVACAKTRQSHAENREARNATSVKRNFNPERIAYMKAYHASHRRDRSDYKKKYDSEHRGQHLARREANKAEIKNKRAEYYRKNRVRFLAKTAADYRANPHKTKARAAAWLKANPLRASISRNRRRVRLLSNGGSHTLDELQEKFSRFGNCCFYCGVGGKLTIDHDIPLCRGGTDNIDNILPACKSCNSSKRTKTAVEFIATGKTKHAPA